MCGSGRPLAFKRTLNAISRTRPLIVSTVSSVDLFVQAKASLPTPAMAGLVAGQGAPAAVPTPISNEYAVIPWRNENRQKPAFELDD